VNAPEQPRRVRAADGKTPGQLAYEAWVTEYRTRMLCQGESAGTEVAWVRLGPEMRAAWEAAAAAVFQRGVAEGIVMAAQELMDRLRAENAIRGDGWRGPETISAVAQWLQERGIDTDDLDEED